MNGLDRIGWSPFFSAQLDCSEQERQCGRIIEVQRENSLVLTRDSTVWASISGRLRRDSHNPACRPVVGDFVVLRTEVVGDSTRVVERILNRRTCLSRTAPGGAAQVIVANVDQVLIVGACGDELNLRRLERYVTMVWESGARPLIVINKSDLASNIDTICREASAVAPGVNVIPVSAETGAGVSALGARLKPGETSVLVGSSGVGKSTLINLLIGESLQSTTAVGEVKDRGRHTTTARHLFQLKSGAMIIDTPGMRELNPREKAAALSLTFEDVTEIAGRCRFKDCSHASEPGCAVRSALGDGSLDPKRWAGFQKLQREAAYDARSGDAALARAERLKWKKISLNARKRPKRWEL